MNKSQSLSATLPKLVLAAGIMMAGAYTEAYASPTPEPLQAEQSVKEIKGTVIDSEGEPLIGATVQVKGTKVAQATDIDGNFVIKTSEANPVLQISYVGCKTAEIAVKGKSTVNVTLEPSSESLDEVVVTALGIKRQAKALGYAVQDVKGDAKTYYENGVRKSMQFYNRDKELISNNVIDAYLRSTSKNLMGTSPAFNDSEGGDTDETNHNSKLFKIIIQKYLALFPEGSQEAYNDYRRLGIPALDPMPGLVEKAVQNVGAWDWQGSVRRLTYPAIENDVNTANIKEAIDRMGGKDETSTRMWWDARQSIVGEK